MHGFPSRRLRMALGAGIWLGALAGAAALVAAPAVRKPLQRTLRSVSEPWRSAPGRERHFVCAATGGVTPGEPVFEAADDRLGAPIGHVVALEGAGLRVRFEPDVEALEAFELTCLAPSRTLGEALAFAVPPESARRLGDMLRLRLGVTFEEAVRPELEARLPAFLARVDPRHDPRALLEVEALGEAVMARLAPLLEGLTRDVTRAVDKRFDLLDRLGLLWKMVRGDGEGLRKDLLPVAQAAAAAWWKEHSGEVLEAVGQGLGDREAELRAWLAGPLWQAAQDELLVPIARAQRARLEAEAQALLEAALAEVVLAPGGGLRPRFASLVRTHLLDHRAPLLLVKRRASPSAGGAALPGAGGAALPGAGGAALPGAASGPPGGSPR